MSAKRNRNKKAWARKRQGRGADRGPSAPRADDTSPHRSTLRVRGRPSELDQVGVLIVEEQLGRAPTDLAGLRAIAARLPFEAAMVILTMLAGRVEAATRDPAGQLGVAEWH